METEKTLKVLQAIHKVNKNFIPFSFGYVGMMDDDKKVYVGKKRVPNLSFKIKETKIDFFLFFKKVKRITIDENTRYGFKIANEKR